MRRLAERGVEVTGTHRADFDVTRPPPRLEIPEGARVLHSIPVVDWKRSMPYLAPLLERASRVVYLSTTGVYGATRIVDENTPVAPRAGREMLRVEEERDVAAGPWSSLILRPAAIYGPGRGVHVSLGGGRHKLWGDGSNYISRIHVEDLAAIAEAALLSDVTGAYPVADDEPCRAAEITGFCAKLMGIAMPQPMGKLPPEDTRSANRRVDGRAIRRALGVELKYPSYKIGLRELILAGDR
jgi:nucleoside-diphosphate-sugar epimerase